MQTIVFSPLDDLKSLTSFFIEGENEQGIAQHLEHACSLFSPLLIEEGAAFKKALFIFEPIFDTQYQKVLNTSYTVYVITAGGEIFQQSEIIEGEFKQEQALGFIEQCIESKTAWYDLDNDANDFAYSNMGKADILESVILEGKCNFYSYLHRHVSKDSATFPWQTIIRERDGRKSLVCYPVMDEISKIIEANRIVPLKDIDVTWGERRHWAILQFRSSIENILAKEFRAAWENFEQAIDKSLLLTARKYISSETGVGYNWLRTDPKGWRKQALVLFPMIVGNAVKIGRIDDSRQDYPEANPPLEEANQLLDDIDAGKRIVDSIYEQWGIPPSSAQTLAYLESNSIVNEFLFTSSLYKKKWQEVSGVLNPNDWPNRSNPAPIYQQWSCLANRISALCYLTGQKGCCYSNPIQLWPSVQELFNNSSAPWKWGKYDFTRSVILELKDTLENLAKELIVPLLLDQEVNAGWGGVRNAICLPIKDGEPSLISEVLGNFTTEEIWELNQRWHRDSRGLLASVGITRKGEWPPLFDVQTLGMLRAVPLCSSAELEEEARIMRHCVDTYAEKCRTENCHIISIQSDGGTRLSTLEIYLDDILTRAFAVQHFSEDDSEPSEHLAEFAQNLIDGINRGQISLDWEGLCEAHEARIQEGTILEDCVPYNWQDMAIREKVWQAWQTLFPKRYASLEYREWQRAICSTRIFQEVVEQIKSGSIDVLDSNQVLTDHPLPGP